MNARPRTASTARAGVFSALASCVPLVLMAAFAAVAFRDIGPEALVGIVLSCCGYLFFTLGAFYMRARSSSRWNIVWLIIPAVLLGMVHTWIIIAHMDTISRSQPGSRSSQTTTDVTAIQLLFAGVLASAMSAIWSIIAIAIFASNPRRGARLQRGECADCGYSRAGLAEGAACPECGASDRS